MEIERKFLIKDLPADMDSYDHIIMEQGYLTTDPVVRVRSEKRVYRSGPKEEIDYVLTYKGKGLMAREEYNLPLTREAYDSLIKKTEGNIISKKRLLIPFEKYMIELDIFKEPFAPLILAEVEFDSLEEADSFIPPKWFSEEVTNDPSYHNSSMSKRVF
ncbi:MAG: CYTH domain-containing protein [Lachnospiraceae bacterium]|nr:CYTH domain-containing protein [Lachnospiraceae bacterium]